MLEVGGDLLSPIESKGEYSDPQVEYVLVLRADRSVANGLEKQGDRVLIDGLGRPIDVLEDRIGDGRAHELRDAFGDAFLGSDGGLDAVVLSIGLIAGLGACVLGLDGVRLSGGGDCLVGGGLENTVGGHAVGGLDGRKRIGG